MARLNKKKTNTSKSPKALIQKSNVADINLSFELKVKGYPYPHKFNLRDWCHLNCNASNAHAVPQRITCLQRLRKWVDLQIKNKVSNGTIEAKLRMFRRYITFCDVKAVDPFSKAGYLAYVGNIGELRRQIGLALEPKGYQFLYHDGEEMGMSEVAALGSKTHLDSVLLALGFDTSDYQTTLQKFEKGSGDSNTVSYTSSEWKTMLRRVQFYFFSLATQLIAYRDENPSSPPPSILEDVVVDNVGGEDITATVGYVKHKGNGGESTAFNQCMSAGYIMFAYYTAFNDTVIQEVRHPLRTVTGRKEGRTMKFVQVKAYKGRSSKEVKALFSGLDESLHPEAKGETDTGFIVANINKRDVNGTRDGIAFIETLKLLSKAYSDDTHGLLIYSLDNNGKKAPKNVHRGVNAMVENLGLLRDRRGDLINHLIASFTEVVESQQATEFKADKLETGFPVMTKEVVSLTKSTVSFRAIPLALAAVTCMTDISLKNILMPLHYSKKDDEGDISISFSYLDGTVGGIKVGAKYQEFFELVERRAQTINPLQNNTPKKGAKYYPPFLFPLGYKYHASQWEGIKLPISQLLLSKCGIGVGDFYLDLNARKIRVTHSDLEYKSEENGFTARQILQHSIETQQTRYINGHPIENIKQTSQGMLGLTKIAEGMSRDEALKEVKKILDIPVLSYDQWKERRMPTNPNGIACDGKIDLVKGKNKHYSAHKFAEMVGVLDENQDITCYQYDLCVFCKSAQLVDDPHAIYKLLSFLDVLKESIDQFPARADFIQKKIERFELHLEDLPYETLEQANDLFKEHERYPLFKSSDAIAQFL